MSIVGAFGARVKPRFNEKPQVRGREWSATLLFCLQGHLSKTTGSQASILLGLTHQDRHWHPGAHSSSAGASPAAALAQPPGSHNEASLPVR